MLYQAKDNMENKPNKLQETISNLKAKVLPKLTLIDSKFQTFMPNPKLRKLTYITMASLFSFMFLIIVLGLLLSPLKNTGNNTGITLNKPAITLNSPVPVAPLSAMQQKLLDLEIKIKNLVFPESILNTPVIETDLKI